MGYLLKAWLFKFGFLGLAFTFAFASCNNAETQSEQNAEDLQNEIEATTEEVADSLENVADSVRAEGEEVVDSLENVQ